MKKSDIMVWSIGIALVLFALCLGLKLAIEPVARALVILVQGLSMAIGLGFAAAGLGTAALPTVSTWVAPIASIGLVTTAFGTGYIVVFKIIQQSKEKPYDWLLPALGLLAIFFVDLTKDILLTNEAQRAVYALGTGLFVIGGGFLLTKPYMIMRVAGFLLPFVPPAVIFLMYCKQQDEVIKTAHTSGNFGLIGLIGLAVTASLVIIFGVLFPAERGKK